MFEDSPFDLSTFSGTARLFPLPNLVLYPHVMQPLHIFEPRYKAMLAAALESDGLIAMAIPAPGWEKNYEGRPPLESPAVLCRVMTYQKTEQDTYNLLLVGLRRIRLMDELPPVKLYREARVEVLEDLYPTALAARRSQLQQDLLAAFRSTLPRSPESAEQWEQLLGRDISLGMLTDIVSYTLDLGLPLKLELLGEPVVDRRAELLCEFFTRRAAGESRSNARDFPPGFSLN